jgi:uncharacterized phage-associated protein
MVSELDSVCKYICEKSGWTIGNLQLQKILYMAQMYYMGKNETQRLVEARFEAWEYGPVEPQLDRKVRMFGADPVKDVFFEANALNVDDPRRAVLDDVCASLLPLSAGALVNLTHWKTGAWAKVQVPGVRGIPISDDAIRQEYQDRALNSEERAESQYNSISDTSAFFEQESRAYLSNVKQERFIWIFIVIGLLNALVGAVSPWGVEAIFFLFSVVMIIGSAHRLEVPWIVTHLDWWSHRSSSNRGGN